MRFPEIARAVRCTQGSVETLFRSDRRLSIGGAYVASLFQEFLVDDVEGNRTEWANAHGLRARARYQLTRHFYANAWAGPALWLKSGDAVVVPEAGIELFGASRGWDMRAMLAHGLGLGNTARPGLNDWTEAGFSRRFARRFKLRGDGGIWRTGRTPGGEDAGSGLYWVGDDAVTGYLVSGEAALLVGGGAYRVRSGTFRADRGALGRHRGRRPGRETSDHVRPPAGLDLLGTVRKEAMERTYTLQDLLAALRRRRLLALVVAGAVLVVGVALALGVPSEYSAVSVVQIEPRRLAYDFFGQNGTPFEDRMRTIKHGILARPVLEVIRETDFYPDLRDDIEEALRKMRRNVEVRLEERSRPVHPRCSSSWRSPVATEEGRPRGGAPPEVLRRAHARGARGTGAQPARDARSPGRGDERGARDAGRRSSGSRWSTRRSSPSCSRTTRARSAVRRASSRCGSARSPTPSGAVARCSLDPRGPERSWARRGQPRCRAAPAQRGRGGLRAEHPDVKRARREFQEALGQREGAFDKFQKERVQTQLARIDDEVRVHETQIASLRTEMAGFQKRIDAAPRWGQEIANRSRDYEVLRAKYASTISRRADAAAAEQLLAADQPTLFRMVETPIAPRLPASPDRPQLLWIALLAAVVLGLGAAALAEWLDASMRGPEDAATLGVPVLAAIPRIDRRRAS